MFKPVKPPTAEKGSGAAREPAAAELFTAHDKFGREVRVTRVQWLESVLRPSLQQHWNDAGQLYNLIFGALGNGFAAHLLEASARQLELDRSVMPERGYVMRGIVLMENRRFDDAEAVLVEGMQQLGETASLLVNLAKVHSHRGNREKADELLWAGVRRDPNLENGLAWWLAIQRERGGEEGYLYGLARASMLEGAWRPQLWLARARLQAGAVDEAVALYRNVLGTEGYESSALMGISGDLGEHGQSVLIPELVGAAYRPEEHDPRAGLHLLQAYLELNQPAEGEALLQALYRLGLPSIKPQLDKFSDAFAKRKAAGETPHAVDAAALRIETVTLTQPVWTYGLENADWLFATKEAQAPVVAFLAWSNTGGGQAVPQEQREDDAGRLTRAVALYLAESTHYWTGYAGHTWVSVVKGGGPVVFGAPADGAEVAAIMPEAVKYFVTGALDAGIQEVTLRVQLWEREGARCVATESISVKPDAVGSAVLVLEKRLLAHLGGAAAQPLDAFYARPASEAMGHYLVELGQAFMLTAIANGHGTKERLWGERSMLEWPLNMALYWSQAEVAKIMYLSGLGKAFHYGSKLLPEFRQRSLVFMKEAARNRSVVARLQPLVWKVFGMQEELSTFLRVQGPKADPAYVAWLRRVVDSG
ncbi:MAG: hypothetical protein ABI919_08950 [Ramlibacter sp.]